MDVRVYHGRVVPGVVGVDGKIGVDGDAGWLKKTIQGVRRPPRVEGTDRGGSVLIVGSKRTRSLRSADFLSVTEKSGADANHALGLDLIYRPEHDPCRGVEEVGLHITH